jgi:hypothetical protein
MVKDGQIASWEIANSRKLLISCSEPIDKDRSATVFTYRKKGNAMSDEPTNEANFSRSEDLSRKLLLAMAGESFDGDVEDFFSEEILDEKADLLLDVAQSLLMAAAFESAAEQVTPDSED